MYVYSFPKSGVVSLVGFDRLEPTGGANTCPGCPPEILNFTIPKPKMILIAQSNLFVNMTLVKAGFGQV